MQDHIAIDPVLPTLGAKIVAMFVIVRIMRFAMERMEAVLARLDTSGKGMQLSFCLCDWCFIFDIQIS